MHLAIFTPYPPAAATRILAGCLESAGASVLLTDRPLAPLEASLGLWRGNYRLPRAASLSAREAFHCFVQAGGRGLNVRAAAVANDKWLAARRFRQAGIPHPRTWLPSEPGDAAGGLMLVKPRGGSRGWGITTVRSVAEALAWQDRLRTPCIIQELIEGAATWRLVATPHEVLHSYRKEGGLIASVSQGARRTCLRASRRLEELAMRMVSALEGDLMGCDLLERDGEIWALEANPGFALYRQDGEANARIARAIVELAGNCAC